jgi:hypothetical protein
MVRAVNFVYGGCRAAAFFAFLLFTFSFGLGQGLPIASPQSTGMNAAKLNQIEQLVNADISDKKLPGCGRDRRTQRKDRLSKGVR